MANREEPQDIEGLDIEEIENGHTSKNLRSRPREIIRIGHEEVDDSPPPRPRSTRTTPSGGRDSGGIKDNKNLSIAVLSILGILMLSNLFLVYQISSLNSRINDMNSNISELTNISDNILRDLNGLKENLNQTPKSTLVGNSTDANLNKNG
jgi:hypothetical protein